MESNMSVEEPWLPKTRVGDLEIKSSVKYWEGE